MFQYFSLGEEKDDQIKAGLTIVYDALRQKGYNPINQIVGYILSEDPTYITTYNNARNIISQIAPYLGIERDASFRLTRADRSFVAMTRFTTAVWKNRML